MDISFIQNAKGKFDTQFKGLTLEIAKGVAPRFAASKVTFCQLIKQGEIEKASKMIIETNKHTEEAKKVRFGFITIMHNIMQKKTNPTFPEFTW